MEIAGKILQRWDLLMTDNDEKKDSGGLHVNVDGGFNISKQAIWRTIVIISTLVTGGGVTAIKVENAKLLDSITVLRQEVTETKANTSKELGIFKSVIDDVVNFLIEEKALQKTPSAKERYQKEIEKIRAKLKPISSTRSESYAGSPITGTEAK